MRRACRRRGRAGAVTIAVLAVVATVSGACGGDSSGDEGATGPGGEVTVLAAASLTDAFAELAEAFEDRNPETSVRTSFAASSALAAQIAEGAPADVFASADEVNMARVVESPGTEGAPEIIASNRLVIAVEEGNPLAISSLEDLRDPGVVLVQAAPEVPAGRYTAALLARAGVEVTPRSLERDVRAVLSKVALGEADAGIVYATDVAAAEGEVDGVALDAGAEVVARYPVVVPIGAPRPDLGAAFVDFVRSPEGQAILADHGFGPP